MIQLSPDAQVETFRTILDMENRGQQLDDIFLRLKNTFVRNAGVVSLPDAVGALDELRWNIQKLEEQVAQLDSALGIRRSKLERPVKRTRIDIHQLRGSTNTIRLPDLVSLLASQQKTGTLRIKSRQGESFVLELLAGAIVHVVSDTPLPSQMLGNILVAQKKLSSTRLKEFLAHYSPQANGRIGQALEHAQLVDKSDLLNAIEIQARQLFQRIFALQDAVFCFTDGRVSEIEHRVTMNTTHLLFEAARQHDEAERDRDAAELAIEDQTEPAEVECPDTRTRDSEDTAKTCDLDHRSEPSVRPSVEPAAIQSAVPAILRASGAPDDEPITDPAVSTADPSSDCELDEASIDESMGSSVGDDATEAASSDAAATGDARVDALARLLHIQRKPALQLILNDLDRVETLRATTDEDLFSIPGIGKKSISHIRAVLADCARGDN